MKKNQHFFITGFIILLIAPNILFFILKDYIDTKNFQNKKLSEKPILSLSNLNSYPRLYEAYYNDHVPFKNQFVKLNNIIDINIFNTITSDRVLLGKEQWLFYKDRNDGDSIADYQGSNLFSQKQLNQIKSRLEEAEAYYKKKNIKFILFIAPNKENIYSEYMPDNIRIVNNITRSDQIVKHMSENTGIPVIYPKEELLKSKEDAQVYYKYDTHWNQVGGFIGSQQLIEKLNGSRAYLNEVKVSVSRKGTGDLAYMLNLGSYLNDDDVFSISGYKDSVKVSVVNKNDNNTYLKYQSDALDKRKILIIRDSFSEAMFDYIPKNFASTIFIHRAVFKPSMIDEEKPDIIVYQLVERYSGLLETFKFY
jgi:hypothetical protein